MLSELPDNGNQQHHYLVGDYSEPTQWSATVQQHLSTTQQPFHILINNTGSHRRTTSPMPTWRSFVGLQRPFAFQPTAGADLVVRHEIGRLTGRIVEHHFHFRERTHRGLGRIEHHPLGGGPGQKRGGRGDSLRNHGQQCTARLHLHPTLGEHHQQQIGQNAATHR